MLVRVSNWRGVGGMVPKETPMEVIEILRDVIIVMGEAVFCFLEKVIDETKTYFFIGIGNHECETPGPEESARQVYMECMDRAMKGPVGGRYLFLSDEQRREHVEFFNQSADVVMKTRIVTARDGQAIRFLLIHCPCNSYYGVYIIKAQTTGLIYGYMKVETFKVSGYSEEEALELFDTVVEAGREGPTEPSYLIIPDEVRN